MIDACQIIPVIYVHRSKPNDSLDFWLLADKSLSQCNSAGTEELQFSICHCCRKKWLRTKWRLACFNRERRFQQPAMILPQDRLPARFELKLGLKKDDETAVEVRPPVWFSHTFPGHRTPLHRPQRSADQLIHYTLHHRGKVLTLSINTLKSYSDSTQPFHSPIKLDKSKDKHLN